MPRKITLASLLCVMLLLMNLVLLADLHEAHAETAYVVQRGDNLTAIAQKYGVSVDAIAKANGIVNVNLIYVGLKLNIPTTDTPTDTKPTPITAPSTSEDQAYIVQSGDSLTAIADRFGIPVASLASANGLSVMSYVYVGQVLRIPKGAANGQGGTGQSQPAPTATVAPAPTATPIPAPTATTAPKPVGNSTEHIVAAGDNLGSIASYYGVTVEAITAANNLSDPNVLYVGQKLIIPAAGSNPVPVAPKPTQVVAPAPVVAQPTTSGKWIDVKLSYPQRLTAYEGSAPVFSSLASAGSTYPTPVGTFNVYVRYRAQAMSGPGYYLPGVPYVMYFYQNYAIHGTYWHNNFGNPMSHGCVNLPTPAAEWIYNWAGIGTPVKIHW